MKPIPSILAALLLVLAATAHGQNPVPPGAPAAAPQTEFQEWLADLDAQWQATFIRSSSRNREETAGASIARDDFIRACQPA